MFSPAGPRPWHTKPGGSRLDALIEQAREKQYNIDDVVAQRVSSIADASMKGQEKRTESTAVEKAA